MKVTMIAAPSDIQYDLISVRFKTCRTLFKSLEHIVLLELGHSLITDFRFK